MALTWFRWFHLIIEYICNCNTDTNINEKSPLSNNWGNRGYLKKSLKVWISIPLPDT